MTGENRIAEMIREMEQTFAERDALYKDREEACQQQFRSLKEREERLSRTDSDRKQSEEALKTLEETLRKKEEELSSREKVFREEKEAYEQEKKNSEEQFREEQIRLKLLEAKLQNEKVRQQTQWMLHEGMKEREPARTGDRDLLEENETLKSMVEDLRASAEKDRRCLEELRDEKGCLEQAVLDLQKEKQDLFRKLLAADEIIPAEAEDDTGKDDAQDLSSIEDPEPEKDEGARAEDFLAYFRVQYPSARVWPFQTEDKRKGIRLETEGYRAEIIPEEPSFLRIGIPMEDSRKLRKTIHRINGDGGMQCRYDRGRKETLISVPFQAEDGPEDVANLLRCILDYEVPALKKEGGGSN